MHGANLKTHIKNLKGVKQMSDETRNIIEAIEDSQLRNIIEVAMTLDKVDRSVLLMQAQALKAGMDIRAGKEQE